jgi:heme-degrading monooxygenase HmoA
MFIAMNRFRVRRGSEEAFEKVWQSRDSYLHRVPGFVEFHLLKGPEAEDHTLYASHTVWQSKSAFEAWTKSEEFRAAHARAGNDSTGPLYLEHPKFEGFEVRQTVTPKAAVAEPTASVARSHWRGGENAIKGRRGRDSTSELLLSRYSFWETPAKKPRRAPYCGANSPMPLPVRSS